MAHWLSRVQICCHLSTISSIVVSFSPPSILTLSTHVHILTCSHTGCVYLTIVRLETDITGVAWITHWCSCLFRACTVLSFGIILPLPRLFVSLPLSLSPSISLLLPLLSMSSSRGWRCGRGQQQPNLWWLHYVSIWDRCPAAHRWQLPEHCSWGAGRGEEWRETAGKNLGEGSVRRTEDFERWWRRRKKKRQQAGGGWKFDCSCDEVIGLDLRGWRFKKRQITYLDSEPPLTGGRIWSSRRRHSSASGNPMSLRRCGWPAVVLPLQLRRVLISVCTQLNRRCLFFNCGKAMSRKRQNPRSHKWTAAQNWDETEPRTDPGRSALALIEAACGQTRAVLCLIIAARVTVSEEGRVEKSICSFASSRWLVCPTSEYQSCCVSAEVTV